MRALAPALDGVGRAGARLFSRRAVVKQVEDVLTDSRKAGRWLTTLTRDTETACQEVASALRKSERFGPFSVQRHEAVLLVDKWAAPLQEELLEHYALGSRSEQGQGSKIARTLETITHSFGRCYDELIEALRIVPRDSDHPYLTYVTLVRRLAHLRYETVLVALGYENSLNWQKIHRLHRSAMQQRVRDAGTPASSGTDKGAPGASAASEYIQILLTHQLTGAKLEPAEVLCAVGWLNRWADSMAISTGPVEGNAFAIYPNGSEGLVAPPRGIKEGLLWLDVTPLHDAIRQIIREEQNTPDVDDGGALSVNQRLVLLHRLLQLWRGPLGDDVRREPRRSLKKSIYVAFNLAGIALAIRQSDLTASGTGQANGASDNGLADAAPAGQWTVNDVSDSGCRLHGAADAAGAAAEVAPGTLVGLRVRENSAWIVGVVRRNVALDGGESDLGVQILSAHVRLLVLDGSADEGATLAPTDADGAPTPGRAERAARAKPALLLGRGTGRYASIKQSMIVLAHDYAHRRDYFCATKRHRYKLTLDKPLERIAECMWASLKVEKIGSLEQRVPPAPPG
jgi:hypothetical protein